MSTPLTRRPSNCEPNFRPESCQRIEYLPPIPAHILNDLIGEVSPREMHALHFLADNADVITVEGEAWILSPAPDELLETLAGVGAGAADIEPETDDVPQFEEDEPQCEDEGAQCDDEGCIEFDLSTSEDEPAFGAWL